MGLKELKKAAREKEFEEYLLSFGITKSDLCNLHDLMIKVREMEVKSEPKPIIPSEEQQKKFQNDAATKLTMEKLVEAFTGESEEFYENGRKQKR